MQDERVCWGHDRLTLELRISPDAPVSLVGMWLGSPLGSGDSAGIGGSSDVSAPEARHAGTSFDQALVEMLAVGHGRARASLRTVESAIGSRLRYTGHEIDHDGSDPIPLRAVTSLVAGIRSGAASVSPDNLDLYTGWSQWLGENQWTGSPLRSAMPDLGLALHGQNQRGMIRAVR